MLYSYSYFISGRTIIIKLSSAYLKLRMKPIHSFGKGTSSEIILIGPQIGLPYIMINLAWTRSEIRGKYRGRWWHTGHGYACNTMQVFVNDLLVRKWLPSACSTIVGFGLLWWRRCTSIFLWLALFHKLVSLAIIFFVFMLLLAGLQVRWWRRNVKVSNTSLMCIVSEHEVNNILPSYLACREILCVRGN